MPRVDDRKSRLAFEERQLQEERTEPLPYLFPFIGASGQDPHRSRPWAPRIFSQLK